MPNTVGTVWILECLDKASSHSLKSIEVLASDMRKLNLKVDLIDLSKLDICASEEGIAFIFEGKEFQLPDCALVRTGSHSNAGVLAIVSMLESCGVKVFNTAQSIALSANKAFSMLRLAAEGIPIPKTYIASHGNENLHVELLKYIGQKIIIKKVSSSMGEGVFLQTDSSDLQSFCRAAKSFDFADDIIYQEFIEESSGKDARVIIVDGKIVQAYIRQATTNDEFRSNLHLGGKEIEFKVPEKMAQICIKAAAVLGLSIAGIDILFGDNDKFMVCEVNSAPHIDSDFLNDKDIGNPVSKCVAEFIYSKMKDNNNEQ